MPNGSTGGARSWRATLLYVLIGLCGVAVVFRPTLLSGFGRIQAERGDTVFINLVLEHQYRSLFWPSYSGEYASLPFFYPVRGTLFYSDTMMGTLPVYAILRLVLTAFTTMQMWTILMLAASYAAMVYLLRRLDVPPLLAALGGFIFAFGMSRGAHLYQQVLMPAWFTPLALAAWVSFRGRPARRSFAFLLGCLAGQLLCAIQLGWFSFFGMTILIVVDVATDPRVRQAVLAFAKARFGFVLVSSGALAGFLAAIAWPYLHTLGDVGWRSSATIATFLPRVTSWLQTPRDAYLSRILPVVFTEATVPEFWEHELFPGLMPVLFALIAVWLCLRRGLVSEPEHSMIRACLITAALLIAVSLYVPLASRSGDDSNLLVRHGGFSLWWLVYDFVPGARGIRAAGRISTVTHFFLLVGGVAGFHRWLEWRFSGDPKERTHRGMRRVTLCGLIVFAMAEHLTAPPSFDKKLFIEELSAMKRALPDGCTAAYFVIKPGRLPTVSHVLAAWAGLEENIAVVNGYSSNSPYGHPAFGRTATKDEIQAWTWSHDVADVCYVSDWKESESTPVKAEFPWLGNVLPSH